MEHYLKLAQERIETMAVGQHFELSETTPDWEGIPKGERRAFGKYFCRLCQLGRIPKVALTGRGEDNHKIYVKLP